MRLGIPLWEKCAYTYVGCVGSYGFYRGYNNLYDTDKFNTREKLVTDNVKNGLAGTLYHLNPGFQLIFLYGICARTEKMLRGIPIEKRDYRD